MKNTKLIFIGMLAVLLAFGLVFTSCEGPTGPAGPAGIGVGGIGGVTSGANPVDLAIYGFSFGTPVHTQYARAPQYPDAIYGGGTPDFDGTPALSVSTVVTVIYGGDTSVQFTLKTATADDILAAFQKAFRTAEFPLQASIAPAPNALSTETKSVLKISGIKDTLTISGINAIFGADGTAIAGSDTNISGGSFTITPVVGGKSDIWSVEVLTAGQNAQISAPATVNLGSKKATFGADTQVSLIGSTLTSAFNDATDRSKYAVPYYYANTATGDNGLVLTFSANYWDKDHFVSGASFVPVITGFTGYGAYNYLVNVNPVLEGRATATGGTDTPAVAYSYTGDAVAATTNPATLVIDDTNDVIKISAREYDYYDPEDFTTYTDITILEHKTGAVAIGQINLTLTGRAYNVPAGSPPYYYPVAVNVGTGIDKQGSGATIKIFQKANYESDYLSLTGSAVSSVFGAPAEVPGHAKIIGNQPGQPALWSITVVAGGNGFLPTKASVLKLSFDGLTIPEASNKPIIVPAGATASDILDLINTNVSWTTIDGYSKTYIPAIPGLYAGGFSITKTAIAAGTTYALSSISPSYSDL